MLLMNVDIVIDQLLRRRPDGFRNKHLAQALGVSRARASQLLAIRVRSGELARRIHGTELRTRQQLREAVRNLPTDAKFLLLDLDGVQALSPAAAKEILFARPSNLNIEANNAEPAVKIALGRIRRLGQWR